MNGSKKSQRSKGSRTGDNVAKKKSKSDVSLKWDEDIGSSDDESHDKFVDDRDIDDDVDEETAEETRKR